MTTNDPARNNSMANERRPVVTSENSGSGLIKSTKTDFSRLRASLKLSDAVIGTVVIVLAFCLVYLIGYLFGHYLNWTTWLFIGQLPIVCMILFPLWLARRRRVGLIHRPRLKTILLEAAIAVPVALILIVIEMLLRPGGDPETRRRWHWFIISGDFRSLLIVIPFIVLIGPVAEELFYRAFLYNSLRSRLPAFLAAAAQAALFSIVHLRGLNASVVLFIHGLCFLGVYVWRKTLLAPVFVHVFGNLIFVVWLTVAMVSYPHTPHLGVVIAPHEQGCLVLEVMPASPADKAGLIDGDIITCIDAQPVESYEDLDDLIQRRTIGDHVTVSVTRDGELLELKAVLDQERGNIQYSPFLSQGRKVIPEIAEFERLFPNYKQAHYIGEPECKGDERWEFAAGLYGQYVLHMNIDITWGPSGRIASHSEPQFRIVEVSSVYHSQSWWNRETSISYGSHHQFNLADWKKLVNSNGDFSAIGIGLDKDRPIADFEKVYPNNR